MEKRVLGRTGLEVSLLTFGCGAVGGLMPKGEPADQRRAVELALDLGVNFFDTAPLYGNGRSETNLGHILADLQPDIVLGTKVRIMPGQKKDISSAVAASSGTMSTSCSFTIQSRAIPATVTYRPIRFFKTCCRRWSVSSATARQGSSE